MAAMADMLSHFNVIKEWRRKGSSCQDADAITRARCAHPDKLTQYTQPLPLGKLATGAFAQASLASMPFEQSPP